MESARSEMLRSMRVAPPTSGERRRTLAGVIGSSTPRRAQPRTCSAHPVNRNVRVTDVVFLGADARKVQHSNRTLLLWFPITRTLVRRCDSLRPHLAASGVPDLGVPSGR